MASILVVCTGNVCRSPMAEGFLRAGLERRFGRAAPSVASAGTGGWEGSRAMAESIEAAAERGVDIASHRGRELRTGELGAADLILAMAHDHRSAILVGAPEVAPKTFTLKEFVRLVEALDPPPDPTEDPTKTLIARVAEADRLRSEGFTGAPADEDVADPLGLPVDMFRAVAWELDEWSRRLIAAVYGPA
jgi:protein-tyrosine phosphatase